jgi:hypothetical protein
MKSSLTRNIKDFVKTFSAKFSTSNLKATDTYFGEIELIYMALNIQQIKLLFTKAKLIIFQ